MKFIIDNIWFIGTALLSGGALLWPHLQQRGKQVSQLEAIQLINQGKSLVLDIRAPEAFAQGHLINAKNIPLSELAQRTNELEKFKAKTLIIVCQAGTQSVKAAKQLKQAGFEQVVSLTGGIASWQSQGLPVAK